MKVNGSKEKSHFIKMLLHLNRSGSTRDHNEGLARHEQEKNTLPPVN